VSRRSFIQLGEAGMASFGLADVLRAKSSSTPVKNDHAAILIWLDGGPSHMDLYDLKPEAPAEYRGIWKPIRTNVPGIEISELFPRQAKVADKFSLVRSLHHESGDHFTGAHMMLTAKNMGVNGGSTGGRFPSICSIVARERGPIHSGMPAHVAVPYASSVGLRPGYFGGNFLGAEYDPLESGGDPNDKNFRVQNLDLAPGLTIARLRDRRDLVRTLDNISRDIDAQRRFAARDEFDHEAFDFLSGPRAREAFQIQREDDKTRAMYGRHSWGQSTLLARRLVEAGSRFVTVHFGGWDHHWNLQSGMESYLPMVDSAVAGLFEDLDQRGMLASTLVILCGEFSRTPRMNNGSGQGTPGRDHWGSSMFCLLGGGGVKGGIVVGSTDAKGTQPQNRPLGPEHVHATIYKCLGVDPSLHLLDLSGRPTPVLEDPSPIAELL
jgi:hypothetical protein